MFWRDAPKLRSMSMASKLAISAFLLLAALGYLFGFLNIFVTYQMTDGTPGLSGKDVELAFYGSPGTALEGAIDGSMRSQFSSDANYQEVKEWIESGGTEVSFGPIQEIFDADAYECHSSETMAAGGLELNDYGDVEPLLAKDTGKSLTRLIALSHTHVLSLSVAIFLLVFIFSFSSYPEWLKMGIYIMSFSAIVLDIGAWWLAKFAPFFSVFVIIGGALLGTSFGVLIWLGLWDVWFGKAEIRVESFDRTVVVVA